MKLFRFLGSLSFALFLIGTTALVAVIGTVLEARSSSHLFAEQFTYGHPLFGLLICGFFLNILCSSLSRWPFKRKHIPFLITHLGLLMILSGVLIKNFAGIQGRLSVMEGTGAHQILLDKQAGVHLEGIDGEPLSWKLGSSVWGNWALRSSSKEPQLVVSSYQPHAEQGLELWTSKEALHVEGLPSLPLADWEPSLQPPSLELSPWRLQAFRAQESELENSVKALYVEGLLVHFYDVENECLLGTLPLKNVLASPVSFDGCEIKARLDLKLSSKKQLEEAALFFEITDPSKSLPLQGKISLNGAEALLHQNTSLPLFGALPIRLSLTRLPLLVFVRCGAGEDLLLKLNAVGEIDCVSFSAKELEAVYALAEGRAGYAIQTLVETAFSPEDAHVRERNRLAFLENSLRQESISTLSPPLKLLAEACEKGGVDFPRVCTEFLERWNHTLCWLYPAHLPLPGHLAKAMALLDWSNAPCGMEEACGWASLLMGDLEERLWKGEEIRHHLESSGWPFSVIENEPCQIFEAVHQKLMGAFFELPTSPMRAKTPEEQARLFSAYLRFFHLHLAELPCPLSQDAPTHKIYLKGKLHPFYTIEALQQQPEKNRPLIKLEAKWGNHRDNIELLYDPEATGLRWPLFEGRFLARFQPYSLEMPHHLRLRDVRKVNYPHSSMPFSYEADLIFTDRRNGEETPVTLSMNHVHETSDGYRFYLSGISPAEEISARTAHLVINYDPVRYRLTYPGGFILCLGIVLLFALNPYKN